MAAVPSQKQQPQLMLLFSLQTPWQILTSKLIRYFSFLEGKFETLRGNLLDQSFLETQPWLPGKPWELSCCFPFRLPLLHFFFFKKREKIGKRKKTQNPEWWGRGGIVTNRGGQNNDFLTRKSKCQQILNRVLRTLKWSFAQIDYMIFSTIACLTNECITYSHCVLKEATRLTCSNRHHSFWQGLLQKWGRGHQSPSACLFQQKTFTLHSCATVPNR